MQISFYTSVPNIFAYSKASRSQAEEYDFIFAVKWPRVPNEQVQGDSFGARPKKTRISQRLFIRF